MQDERPIDLAELGGDLPTRDLVRPAVRRFRLHVVLLTVVSLIGGAAGAAWIAEEVISTRRDEQIINSWLPTQFYEATMVNGREAWFAVGSLDIGVLQVRPLADGRIGIRILLIATEPRGLMGDCCMLVTEPPSETESILGLRGDLLTPGETTLRTRLEDFMLAVPAEAGRTLEVHVVEVGTMDEVGSFTVSLDDLRVPKNLDDFFVSD